MRISVNGLSAEINGVVVWIVIGTIIFSVIFPIYKYYQSQQKYQLLIEENRQLQKIQLDNAARYLQDLREWEVKNQ